MSNLKNKRSADKYSAFLKHIEEEKDETSNFAKTLLILILIVLGLIVVFY